MLSPEELKNLNLCISQCEVYIAEIESIFEKYSDLSDLYQGDAAGIQLKKNISKTLTEFLEELRKYRTALLDFNDKNYAEKSNHIKYDGRSIYEDMEASLREDSFLAEALDKFSLEDVASVDIEDVRVVTEKVKSQIQNFDEFISNNPSIDQGTAFEEIASFDTLLQKETAIPVRTQKSALSRLLKDTESREKLEKSIKALERQKEMRALNELFNTIGTRYNFSSLLSKSDIATLQSSALDDENFSVIYERFCKNYMAFIEYFEDIGVPDAPETFIDITRDIYN